MLITRECDYAVRVVRALAEGERRLVGAVCEEEHIPQPYAYKILKKLEKAGIVQGYRGANGGYQLARPLELVSLYDIVIAVEEHIALNACLMDGADCPNNLEHNRCKVHLALSDMQAQLVSVLRSQTMDQILL